MTNTLLDSEIRSKIDDFLDELAALVKQAALESVREALGENAAGARRGPGGPRLKISVGRPARSAMGPGGKRTSEQVEATAQRIAEYVRSNPGARLEAIASGLGTSSKELKLPVIKLLSSKTLTKKGEKRGTMYFPGGRAPGLAQVKSARGTRRK
jgi:hypothetical protein